MWTATRVSADFAQNVQVQAGILLHDFDITDPVEPADNDIVCATTGDITVTCTPETEDWFEDVNNVPNNALEGKRITGWNCEVGLTCLEITEDTLLLGLGAADVGSDGGIHPRTQYKITDFKSLYWVGDMVDESKLFVVAMDNTVSTGGLSLTTSKDSKGQLGLTLTPHASLANQEKIPMAFYVLEKVGEDAVTYSYTEASPVGTENPRSLGWYVLRGDNYVLTTDTTVDDNKTYYTRS